MRTPVAWDKGKTGTVTDRALSLEHFHLFVQGRQAGGPIVEVHHQIWTLWQPEIWHSMRSTVKCTQHYLVSPCDSCVRTALRLLEP